MFLVRSNYFAVRNEQAFLGFCSRNSLEVIESDGHPRLFGFLSSQEAQPDLFPDDSLEAESLISELPRHLADETVAIVVEVGSDKMRFLLGHAWALNNKGEVREVDLCDIYHSAQALGAAPMTRAEY